VIFLIWKPETMKMNITKMLAMIAAFAAADAFATLATDDFESGTLTGGTGAWTSDWTHAGAGGAFVNTDSRIDGVNAAGVYTLGAGTATLTRSFSAINTPGDPVDIRFTISGLSSSTEIGVNLQGLKSDTSTNILTLKFTGAGTGFTLNDGGTDFVAAPSVTYADGEDYDVRFTSTIGSTDYFWSVSQRGGPSDSNLTAFTYSGAATLSSASAIQFFWTAPDGPGNDGLIDSVSVIPEPSAAFLLLFGGAGLTRWMRRRKA
jgi:hypothetical protein